MRARLLLLVVFLTLPLLVLSGATPEACVPQPDPQSPKAADALPGIVFVAAPIFDEQTDGGVGVYQGSYHWRDSYIYARSSTYHRGERTMGPVRPGRNLYALVPARPDGKLTRLTHLKTGSVFKPSPSFDGKKILFAMRRDGEDWFHQYEIDVDGTNLRQLTDGPFNDFAGVYLPDGHIVFCSDRTGYLEEYHEERTETLFTMSGDGTNIRQLTFAPGTYFEPSVLQDGRILFSFWDAFHIDVPPYDKHETYLMTVRPDGTEERHLFGAGQYRFFNRERHSGIGLTQAREMPDGRILVQSEMGPSLLDPRAGLSVRDALAPIFPGTTSIQLGGTTHRSHLSPLGTRSTAYPLADGRILFSATAPGARDSAVYVCDPDTRREQLVVNIPNYAEFDAVPVLTARPLPKLLPQRPVPADTTTTRFLVVAGHIADNPERAKAMKRARYFRVVEAEYTGVTTSSHTNLETRILGVVPIQPDGSAYFEAPADTPLFLDPLDAGGNRVLMEWNYLDTSVAVGTRYPALQMAYMVGRAGETRSCYGCHASQTDAVPNTPPLALKLGTVKVERTSTNLQYRRNDPEAYRRQARLDEEYFYIKQLSSKDPVVRARACEMLMYVEDMGRTIRRKPQGNLDPFAPEKTIEEHMPLVLRLLSQLLADKVVEVRRAASLALTRLATSTEKYALRKAYMNEDWQVRFHVVAALESIGDRAWLGKQLPGGYDDQDPFETASRQNPTPALRAAVRKELEKPLPNVLALRAAGKLKDADAVKLLAAWLKKHEHEYHAAEAAVALGRIGTKEAVTELLAALRSEVPIKKVHISRYLQHGPRPEEYALLKALVIASAKLDINDLYLLISLLPNTFMEKPRFEDRLREESQRVLLPRLLLTTAEHRRRALEVLVLSLRGQSPKGDPVYEQLLKGVNLERPFSEHGRPFPVLKQLGAEESLWLLGCLLKPAHPFDQLWIEKEKLEALVTPFLKSDNHRERIDTAVLLGRIGFGPKTAAVLAAEVATPYAFPEITAIGKGMPDLRFRDKAYLVQNLARHVADVNDLKKFADPKAMFRDIRYGLVRGLAQRGKADALPLLGELATRDPITLIRQQARYAIADIQDGYRLSEKKVPEFKLPPEQPLEALYPPRGLKWADTQFVEFDAKLPPLSLEQCLTPANFRNLNMAQATGAKFMMTGHVEETRLAFAALAKQPDAVARPKLLAALESPYPYAHALAAAALAERNDRSAIPVLLAKLPVFLKTQNTVGYWACCEALARLKAKEAVPVLVQQATATNPPGTYGPQGMPTGYVAARSLAYLVADAKDKEVVQCLTGDNIWLRAGALRGLAEAGVPGVEALLQAALGAENPALVRQEAQVQLGRWRKR